jgi:hypothetical protein
MTPPNGQMQIAGSTAIRFEAEGEDITIVDTVERRRYSLTLSTASAPAERSADRFRFPIDAAVAVETDAIALPTTIVVYVRDDDGEMLAETGQFADERFPEGEYSLELCAPMKIYARVRGPLSVTADADGMCVEFPERTTVELGARSKHDRPAGTITTTDDPEDVMAAVSALGSSLKTTSPERSYPTLRGHPPTIERGDRLSIPEPFAPPETGIRIELPAEYRYVYVVASLAYYLGATVEPAEPGVEPRIVTDSGYVHPLGTGEAFEREVERTLKRTFFLDCLTRTEGLYPIDLHERRRVEDAVDLDFADLYDRSPASRLEAYLEVPYDVIEPQFPDWKLTSHVDPTADSVEMLPFLVNDLAVIRMPAAGPAPAPTSEPEASAVEGFLRSPDSERSAGGTAVQSPSLGACVEPETADSLEQAWVGSETPMGASKATPQAYRNRLDREQSSGDIGIVVVCNDPEMEVERGLVDSVYGSREELPFDVRVQRNLRTDELAAVLETDTDFLHYIGHIESEGFECPDGRLDATDLDRVGVDAFLLNGCRSYDQGMALIDGGAIGGIATLTDVANAGAVSIGSDLARLLNCGFPLRAALEVAKEDSVIGEQYLVVGDGGMTIAQPEGGTPCLYEIEQSGEEYEVSIRTHVNSGDGMGSMLRPTVEGGVNYYLNSGHIDTFRMTKDELGTFLFTTMPIKFDGELFWSDEVDLNEFLPS